MRKRRAIKRDVLPDPIYNSKVVTKLINAVMNDGKKGTATRIVNEAFDKIKEQTKIRWKFLLKQWKILLLH